MDCVQDSYFLHKNTFILLALQMPFTYLGRHSLAKIKNIPVVFAFVTVTLGQLHQCWAVTLVIRSYLGGSQASWQTWSSPILESSLARHLHPDKLVPECYRQPF